MHSERLRFAHFEFDPVTGELTRDGAPIHLQHKPARLLAQLASRPGELLTRDELHALVWGEGTHLEFDQALNFAVKQIRVALDDHADKPQFIETLPQRGYRFIAEVRRYGRPSRSVLSASRRGAAPVLAVSLLVGIISLWTAVRGLDIGTRPDPEVSRLTSLLGEESYPSLSPDGSRVAFVWSGPNQDNRDVYLGEIHPDTLQLAGPPLRLTSDPRPECCPSWSPDASQIAFIRVDSREGSLQIMPARGGPARELTSVRPWFGTAVTWSADGTRLGFSDRRADDEPYSLFQIAIDSLKLERLTEPPVDAIGDAFPAFSADGASLAFARIGAEGDLLRQSHLYVMPAGGGDLRRLTSVSSFIGGVDWNDETREIVFSSARQGTLAIWRIPASGGAPARVEGVDPAWELDDFAAAVRQLSPFHRVSSAGRARRLAYVEARFDVNIYRMELDDEAFLPGVPNALSSSRVDSSPQFSPDGRLVAFSSTRTGTSEIWVGDSDGSSCTQLTALQVHSSSPYWSPDGSKIAFDTRSAGQADIHVVDVASRVSRALTHDLADDVVPTWSRNGRRIYFGSDRSGAWEIWKVPSGGGNAIQVTDRGGFAGLESPDGEWLYYSKVSIPGLWRRPTTGGDEQRVLDELDCWGQWDLTEDGIYILASANARHPRLRFLALSSGELTTLVTLDNPVACGDGRLSVAPDRESLLVTQRQPLGSDLMLVHESPD